MLAVVSGFTRFAAGRIDGDLENKRRRSRYAIVTPIVVFGKQRQVANGDRISVKGAGNTLM